MKHNAVKCSIISFQGSDAMYIFEYNSPGEEYYLATRVNPYNSDYLDIVLEGEGFGWVVVGVSRNKRMVSKCFIYYSISLMLFFYD